MEYLGRETILSFCSRMHADYATLQSESLIANVPRDSDWRTLNFKFSHGITLKRSTRLLWWFLLVSLRERHNVESTNWSCFLRLFTKEKYWINFRLQFSVFKYCNAIIVCNITYFSGDNICSSKFSLYNPCLSTLKLQKFCTIYYPR